MLSLTLRQLESDGLVERTVFAEVPPRVEYSLTAHGKSLLPLVEEMAAWGRKKTKDEGQMVEVNRKKSLSKK
ncbi:MAG: winged helix-turn-helix transcriptional regulator [Bacteroidetes bacterium]|nr:winged helix-turn-helix transcriptional regulator [Bacteroidota bacterium]